MVICDASRKKGGQTAKKQRVFIEISVNKSDKLNQERIESKSS
jgi:hypothetical protein